MTVSTLQELFNIELADLYDAEHQILEALPKMIDASNSADLKYALDQHLKLTKTHVDRLEDVFEARARTEFRDRKIAFGEPRRERSHTRRRRAERDRVAPRRRLAHPAAHHRAERVDVDGGRADERHHVVGGSE